MFLWPESSSHFFVRSPFMVAPDLTQSCPPSPSHNFRPRAHRTRERLNSPHTHARLSASPVHHARNRKNTLGTAFVHRTTNCPLLSAGVTGESSQTAGKFVANSSRAF